MLRKTMLLAVDVAYQGEHACVAGVLFYHWTDGQPNREQVIRLAGTRVYVPGQFYQRELPCILALLQTLPERPAVIVIDGYVYLGADKRDGLGWHLYQALGESAAVIGVAKTCFKDTPLTWAVYRGRSQRPVYVTAIGVDELFARQAIAGMHGPHRIPTLLKRADQLCRRGLHCEQALLEMAYFYNIEYVENKGSKRHESSVVSH